MSVWQPTNRYQLSTDQGDLLRARVTVEAYLLEDLLEALSEASFPINPEIHHHVQLQAAGGAAPAVRVDFPVWRSQLAETRELLSRRGFENNLEILPMLAELISES